MQEIMININKLVKAKMYGFDEAYYEPDGKDKQGEYILVEVQFIVFPHLPYIKSTEIVANAGRSDFFEILPHLIIKI